MLFPNDLLSERYRIVELLGSGPAGAVYRAWDEVDQREVAVKLYENIEPGIERLFREEVQRLTRLDHRQLPKVLDSFVAEDGRYFLISEYIPGVDLQRLLEQYGPLPAELITGWLAKTAAPLTYLHDQKQMHLNLKPANLRLTPDGRLYVVDTGLPGLGIPAGDPAFAAPEQAKQLDAEPRSDVYALGAILYTLMTGVKPPSSLKRESGLELLNGARELNPQVAPYLSILANKAMSMRPELRPDSVEAFVKGLKKPAGGDLATATLQQSDQREAAKPEARRPSGFHKRPVSRRRQIQTRTIWGLVGILLVLVAVIYGWFQLNQATLVGGSEEAATATVESQVISALTAIAPTDTPTPLATEAPTPTPAPLLVETGMRMLFVPGGVFRLGNNDGEPNEQPSILVNLDPFYIDETEVTNSQYELCVAEGICNSPSRANASYHPAYYGAAEFNDYPVVFVTWYQAETFCEWRGARLPSEAEWERAAGYNPETLQRTLYPWGDEFDGNLLNYCESNCPRDGRDQTIDDGHLDTAPVGSYPDGRSWIGAADMLGNAMEWVNDWYARDYYQEATQVNPGGPPEGEFKSLRGGSWFSRQDEIGNTVRGFFDPTVSRATLGFRCAVDVP